MKYDRFLSHLQLLYPAEVSPPDILFVIDDHPLYNIGIFFNAQTIDFRHFTYMNFSVENEILFNKGHYINFCTSKG